MRPLTLLPLVMLGCLADVSTEDRTARLGDDLLPADDKHRIEAAFDEVLRQGDAAVRSLEAEITRLEGQNQAKAAEIDSLVRQIEDRRAELERQHQNNLILCLFFPDPSICALAVVIDNDSRMRDYNTRLTAARSEQSRVQADMARYRQRRDALREKIRPVRESRERLVAAIAAETGPAAPEVLAGSPEAAAAWVHAEVTGELSRAFRTEIDLLVEIRNAAAELAASLDAALVTLRGLADEVDGLVQSARDAFLDLLEGLASGDPEASARKFLDDAIARRTRELLASLDYPVRELVEHLLDTRADGEPDPAALEQALLDALQGDGGGAPPEHTYDSLTPLSVRDNTEAVSALIVPAGVTATELEVSLHVTHTYRGDLRVWLSHEGLQDIVLHDRTGRGADDLDLDSSFTLPAGFTPSGTWRLHVADEEAQDEGTLDRWRLTLR